MYDLIIIGGGPAGLTAAVYSIRKRLTYPGHLGEKRIIAFTCLLGLLSPVIRNLEIAKEILQVAKKLIDLDFSRKMDGVEKVDQVDIAF